MEKNITAPLRSAASEWTLAGDKQLLDILQNIHQSLMTRCQEVNQRLDEMVSALDDANIDLQNVNNKFMALSNSQFVESRVYDDDIEETAKETTKDVPQPPTQELSDLDSIIQSVRVLEAAHEAIQIVGSDSDTDSDDITSVVLKAKDVYRSRPLPHIIGSIPWRNKWHAGLLVEDSDTDSVTSKPGTPHEVYSDTEPDDDEYDDVVIEENRDPIFVPDKQESTNSSEIFSEQDSTTTPIMASKPTPSDVAAELHRRLRGDFTEIPQVDTDFTPAQSTTRKIYRPEQPTISTIFPDEPPPFEGYQSGGDQYSQEEDDDIFAELQKSKPHSDRSKVQSRVAEDLFGGFEDKSEDIFNELAGTEQSISSVANKKSTLFEDEQEPELFTNKPVHKPTLKQGSDGESVKKPIGGISLFGTNKGAESIGAAIMRRNRRKSSSEEDDATSEETPKLKEVTPVKTEKKNIFDDLFAKSERQQEIAKENNANVVVVNKRIESNKVDLFSDNLFDDIDDIFTTDVIKIRSKDKERQSSVFDDAEDDLFANVAVSETAKRKVIVENKNKSIFDSDDELFSENGLKTNVQGNVVNESVCTSTDNEINRHNEHGNDIFDVGSINSGKISNSTESKEKNTEINSAVRESIMKIDLSIQSVKAEPEIINTLNNNNYKSDKPKEKTGLLFDDDDDSSDDLFINAHKNVRKTDHLSDSSSSTHLINKENTKSETKTSKISIFDDVEDLLTRPGEPLESTLYETLDSSNVSSKPSNSYNIFDKLSEESNKHESFAQNNFTVEIKDDDTTEKTETTNTKSSIFGEESDNSDEFLFGNNNNRSENIETNKDFSHISNKMMDSAPSELDVKNYKSSSETEQKIDNVNCNDNAIDKRNDTNSDPNITSHGLKPEIPEIDFTSTSNSVSEENKKNSNLLNAVKNAIFGTSDDIFSDIMDEPPIFEKPKEPKKSKNVNALFDDDSDDEALFFKKNDVTFDDKPDNRDNVEQMFGVFHNEPPAIDINFTQKENKNANRCLLETHSDEHLFKTTEAKTIFKKVNEKVSKTVETSQSIFKEDFDNFSIPNTTSHSFVTQDKHSLDTTEPNLETEVPSLKSAIVAESLEKKTLSSKKSEKLDEQTNSPSNSNVINPSSNYTHGFESDTPDSPESKKIGKLKNMNFNINVSTLLPGASPKKKIIEQVDGQVFSARSQEDLHDKSNIEHTIIKSVSFEGDPDSQILDNKISKERAKIQVRRRPSTRRARKEAVRKSVLDLDKDSTDNSTSTDDTSSSKQDTVNGTSKHSNYVDQNLNDINNKLEEVARIEPERKNSFNYAPKAGNVENINIKSNESFEIVNQPDKDLEINSRKKIDNNTVKSKIVYILNDEDIFNTTLDKPAKTLNKALNVVDDDDDDELFRNSASSSQIVETKYTINTLGNVDKNTKVTEIEKNLKKSIFDDLSEDENELFNAKKNVSLKSNSILDSDSKDDLFGSRREMEKKTAYAKETSDTKPRVALKASLFGDEDDDDENLFGAKAKVDQVTNSVLQIKPLIKDVVSKTPEPVLNDPLSLLNEEDN